MAIPLNQCPSALSRKLLIIVVLAGHGAIHAEKCYEPLDPKTKPYNGNRVGTACHRQVAKVRKLEFDPRFDCTRAVRLEWVREVETARRMGCNV